MKRVIQLLIFIISLNLISQNTEEEVDLTIYGYKSFEDYNNDVKEELGKFVHFTHDLYYDDEIFFIDDKNKRKKLKPSKIWGFTIDNKLFRVKKGFRVKVVYKTEKQLFRYYLVQKNKGKIFYSFAPITLTELLKNRKIDEKGLRRFTSISKRVKYYRFSETLSSKMLPLSKLNEGSNKDLFSCFDGSLDRYDGLQRYKDLKKCIDEL